MKANAQSLANTRAAQARADANPVPGVCKRCGEEFADRSITRNRRFCSDNCRRAYWRTPRPLGLAVCAHCGTEFEPNRVGRPRKYCAACPREVRERPPIVKRGWLKRLWHRVRGARR